MTFLFPRVALNSHRGVRQDHWLYRDQEGAATPSRLYTSTPGAGGHHGCALPVGRGWEKGRGRCLGCHRNNTNDNKDGHLSCGQAVNGTHSAPVPGCAGGGGKGHRSQMTGEVVAISYYTWLCLEIYRSTGFV